MTPETKAFLWGPNDAKHLRCLAKMFGLLSVAAVFILFIIVSPVYAAIAAIGLSVIIALNNHNAEKAAQHREIISAIRSIRS